MEMIKISENTEIFSEKENGNSCLPLKEVGTFIFKMELYKPNSEYKFPEDYYALASTKKEAWEVEIPKDYKMDMKITVIVNSFGDRILVSPIDGVLNTSLNEFNL